MSSKLTVLTESSPSAMKPSVLCGSGALSQLASPSMASSGHFNPSQTYDSYKAVEFLDPACTELFAIPTSLPPASPSPSHARPALNQAVRPSPIQKPRNSPIATSQHLQPITSPSRRRYGFSPLPFPAP
ncbi:hypothetical protein O181_116093 [Austropuccinia psidii MF-1]|uniref:Uncharacterized protein n=1 Tax=Austropuccinia psidii MF-1 TaxID=1389203 RepID=A0A9Q3PW69_9BASI|nr:hypothetical protein [Austropuccinia psidii MF-1]